jgi:ribose 5-phosphate isomerase B
MKISLGADHAGFALKEELKKALAERGHDVVDHGTASAESTDYPDYAVPVGEDVAQGRADRGVLVCSTGVGMSITANKIHGVRAALAMNPEEVRLTREHNDANVIALGGMFFSPAQAMELIEIFLNTEFHGGRHARRVSKIMAAEQR